jgi:5-methylcytosine-specific restriction enzyme A
MKQALFLNGVYEDVLEEIAAAQDKEPDLVCYLQPYKAQAIKLLAKKKPSGTKPIPLYISLTSSLRLVEYTAQIVGWDDKRALINNTERLAVLNRHIRDHQPSEVEIYPYSDDEKTKPCVNLLAVKDVKRVTNPFSVTNLVKISDGTPCKPRTRSGGWSPVFEIPKWAEIRESGFLEKVESDLECKLSESRQSNSEIRKMRLSEASPKPEEIQVISRGFRRNADVIVEVLLRAEGRCERCHSEAPFIRKKDGSPYLEVHHRVTLADGGDDTTDNAMAVCPNCHRELHFGA